MKQLFDVDNLAEYMAVACKAHWARPAFFEGDVCLTYGEWWDQSTAVAAHMAFMGAGPGDRIAVILPNGVTFPLVTAAVLRLGCVQVNCNPLYTARELGHQLNDSGAKMAVLPGAALSTLIATAPRDLTHVILTGPCEPFLLEKAPVNWTISLWDDILADAPQAEMSWPALTREDLAFLQYTGGTTGPSKGAMLTHGNILANIEQFMDRGAAHLGHGNLTVLTALPLYHIFALTVNLFSPIALGAVNILIADARNLDRLVDAWRRHDVNFVTGVNTLFKGLSTHPGFEALRFHPRLFTMGGGAAVQAVVSSRWEVLTGGHIKEGYGLSETSPILTCTPLDEPRFLGSIGFPVKDTQIVLRDEKGQDAEDGATGELCASGPQVMQGYWRNSEATTAAFTPDGFFRTGDMARRDRDERYYIVDRIKDMILVSGFNVYPNEIEAVISELPGVAECACVGVPDGQGGEVVAVYIVRRDEALSADMVSAYCRSNLTAYKVPRHVIFIGAMPKSAVGKILRRELRELALTASPHES